MRAVQRRNLLFIAVGKRQVPRRSAPRNDKNWSRPKARIALDKFGGPLTDRPPLQYSRASLGLSGSKIRTHTKPYWPAITVTGALLAITGP